VGAGIDGRIWEEIWTWSTVASGDLNWRRGRVREKKEIVVESCLVGGVVCVTLELGGNSEREGHDRIPQKMRARRFARGKSLANDGDGLGD
jgi:hypothetical protein